MKIWPPPPPKIAIYCQESEPGKNELFIQQSVQLHQGVVFCSIGMFWPSMMKL